MASAILIAPPPSLAGGVQLTSAAPDDAVAVTAVGAPGAVTAVGVTAFDWAETGPSPTEFDACTVNV